MRTPNSVFDRLVGLLSLRTVGLLAFTGGLVLLVLPLASDRAEPIRGIAVGFGCVVAGVGCYLALRASPGALAHPWRLTTAIVFGIPALLYLIGVAIVFPFQIDDSYISMRYASNLAAGYGLVFNPGGPSIEGYTNLLLVLIEAALIRMGVQELWPVKILMIGCGLSILITMTWYGRRLLDDDSTLRWLPMIVAFLTATSSPFVLWTTSGMETILFVFLVCLGVVGYLTFLHGRLDGWRVLFIDLVLVLAVLARPEGLLFWAATVVHTLVVGFSRRAKLLTPARVASILIGFGLLVIYGLWKQAYFGQLLPATYLAKQPSLHFRTYIEGGARLLGFLSINGNYFLAILSAAGLILAVFRRKGVETPLWYIVGLCGMYLAYVASLGFRISMDDAYRFYVPLIPLMSLLFFEIALAFRDDIKRAQSVWLVGCLLSIVFLLPLRYSDLWHAWHVDLNWGVLPYRIAARDVASGLEQGHIALGRWLREHASPDATIVLYDAGAIPFFSGLRTIDTWSLTDPHLVRLRRALRSATSQDERDRIQSAMRAYVLSQDPEYIVQDNLSLLNDPVVQNRYRPSGKRFIYLNYYMCGRQQVCRYILEPWERRALR